MKKQVRTRKCGCGSCQLAPANVACPEAKSNTAIWLYSSDFSGPEESVESTESVERAEQASNDEFEVVRVQDRPC